MALTPLPTPPSRQDPVNFSARADAFLAALPTMVAEFNASTAGESAAALASDLASTSAGKGAALAGIADAGGYYTGANVEAALQETGAKFAIIHSARDDFTLLGNCLDARNTSSDASSIVQAIFDSRRSFRFPKGKYRIATAVGYSSTTPPGGLRIEGDGGSLSDMLTTTRLGAETFFAWDGALGGTMFEFPSLVGVQFANIGFCGKYSAGSNQAGVLLKFTKSGSFGSGSHNFAHTQFHYADVGVQFGNAPGDTNCDTSHFTHTQFYRCLTGFKAANNQALGFQFDSLYATDCPRVIDMQNGGHIGINQANFNGCGPNATGGTSADWQIYLQTPSSNSFTHVFINVKAENNSYHVCKTAGYSRVKFIGFMEGQSDQNQRMFETDGGVITLESGRLTTNDATTRPLKIKQSAGGFRSSIILREMVLEAALPFNHRNWVEIDANSSVGFVMENCTSGTNDSRIQNICNAPEYGDVVHIVQTTGNVATNLYFDGAAAATTSNTLQIPTDTAWQIDVFVQGKQASSANCATFHRRLTVVNNAGTLTQVGATQTLGVDNNVPAWGAPTVTVASTFVRATVTGAAATTIDWTARFSCQRVG